MTTKTSKTSLPFASIRSSKDHSLAAFGAALLAAFALSAGAFLPRLDAAGPDASARPSTPAYAAAAKAPAKRG